MNINTDYYINNSGEKVKRTELEKAVYDNFKGKEGFEELLNSFNLDDEDGFNKTHCLEWLYSSAASSLRNAPLMLYSEEDVEIIESLLEILKLDINGEYSGYSPEDIDIIEKTILLVG